MAVDEMDQLVTCSMDDTVRYTNLSKRDYRLVELLPFVILLQPYYFIANFVDLNGK